MIADAILSRPTGSARRAMALFYIQPFSMGAWLVLIPEVKRALGLSDAGLAIALLGMPVALVPMLQIAARMTERFGPRRTIALAFPAQAAALWLVLQAGGLAELFAALMVFGAVGAFLQVGLNVYAGRLEKSAGVYIMSRCHGFWALGLMSGSALAAGLSDLPVIARAMAIAIPSVALGVLLARSLPQLGAQMARIAPPRRALRDLPPAFFAIALFALGIALTEGAMGDWSAVYMTDRLSGDAARGAFAVTIYSGFLAAGRFAGDTLRGRWGIVALARGLTLLALAGVLLLTVPSAPWAAWLGFAAVGLGVSVGFPLAVSAVAALDDTYESSNIALMSTIAISGFLIGPPLIGFLAESFSLRAGLFALAPILCAGFVLARFLAPGESASHR